MQVNIKLFAGLNEFLPPGARHNEAPVQAAPGTTLGQLIERLNIPDKRVHLVLLNGIYVEHRKRGTTRLADGDAVALWPPVAGG